MFHIGEHLNGWLHHYFRNKELNELYLSVAIKAFAVSFISIFVPIYLLDIGYDIVDVAGYYLFYYVIVMIFMPFWMKLNHIWGIKKVMALGTFLLAAYYLLLNYLATGNISLYFVSFVASISTSLYYSAFHIEFTRASDNKEEASEFSLLSIVTQVATSFGPLIGALFITSVSFNLLFLIVSVLLIVSVVPLFFSDDYKIKQEKISVKSIMTADSKEKGLAYSAEAITGSVNMIFWPIFIYLTLESIVSLGFIMTSSMVLMIVFTYFVGKWSDRNKNKVLSYGIFFGSFSWLLRLAFLSPAGVFFTNLFSSFSNNLVTFPISKYVYEGSKKTKRIADYFLFREAFLEIGRIIMLTFAIIVGIMTPNPLRSLFWVFVFCFFVPYFFYFLIRKNKS